MTSMTWHNIEKQERNKTSPLFFLVVSSSRMRYVVIDIRPLLPKHPPTGVPEYTRELIKALLPLAAHKKKLRLILFSSGQEEPDMDIFAPLPGNVSHYHLRFPNKLLNLSFKLLRWPTVDTLIRRVYDIPPGARISVFAPNINLLPLSRQARLVVTFHDLSFERYPFFLKRKEAMWHRIVNPYAIARRADRIIAVSESTKQDLVHLYRLSPLAIKVIYSGVHAQFLPVAPRHHDTGYRVLYLGSSEGRKNVSTLVRAFHLFKKHLKGKEAQLVLAGPPHRVVPFEDRASLYQKASIFVYPSFFEGFGLPPVEAMRCGIPVITSYTSSLPEAVGDAALLVNPHKAHELAYAMGALLTQPGLYEYYRKAGIRYAARFNWQQTARATLEELLI